MAFNEQEEAKVRELLAAFENGKRIADLEPAQGEPCAMRIEVMDASGETRSMELERAVAEAGNPIAGRWFYENMSSPGAGGWFGSLEALKNLPATLGLGRYLVTDDRQMRKLDPKDSRYFEDGSPAALDGSMGQCMWCWNRPWYFSTWLDGPRRFYAITLKPLEGKTCYRIPVGGVSWLGAGVVDRTNEVLCSVISDDERYRGGPGIALKNFEGLPDESYPQTSMLGMPCTAFNLSTFGEYARKRGEGWEANWYVAQTAVSILIMVIMGTKNIKLAYHSELDEDGLMHGGFGTGVTDMPEWSKYNNGNPLIPTSVGVEMGDRCGLVEYSLPPSKNADNQDVPYHTFNVPCFFGLMNANYGNLHRWVRGIALDAVLNEKTIAYAAPSLYKGFVFGSLEGMSKITEISQKNGWISIVSMDKLLGLPTRVGGSMSSFYACCYFGQAKTGIFSTKVGGASDSKTYAGLFASYSQDTGLTGYASHTCPLCFFKDDPII